jgi:uncharacterized membrane protein
LIVEVFRFLVIPAMGAALAALVFTRVDGAWWEARCQSRRRLALLVAAFAVMALVLLGARYLTWHSFVHDLGSYDQKVWLTATRATLPDAIQQTYRGGTEAPPCGEERYWGICHFQPLYLVFALVYRLWASPLVLLGTQVLLVTAAAIPCYRLARARLTAGASALVVLLYLAQPAVQFNALLDFRPDHIAIPLFFWAYVLADRGRFKSAVGAAVLPGLAKESLILALTGFGLFLIAQKRRLALGLAVTVVSVAVFAAVVLSALGGPQQSEAAFMMARYFSAGGALAPALLARKLVYLAALLAPLGFLPLLAPRILLPAVPAIAIALLSNDATHTSIQSQYSAAMVAPLFAALIVVAAWLPGRFGEWMAPARVLGALLVFSLTVSFAIGPSPLSMNFWSERWGKHWHFSRYLPDRQAAMNAAAALIPDDPGVMVVSQNDVNGAKLAHRYFYFAFPNGLERADYVFLDTRRMPFVYWVAKEPERYAAIVRDLRASADYRVAFEQDGVLLFTRVTERRPGVPDRRLAPAPPAAMPQ